VSVIDPFMPGDFIEVTPLENERGTHRDWGVLRGTALDEVNRSGSAVFFMEPARVVRTAASPHDPVQFRFNANEVDVRLLFSAKVARLGRLSSL
jgi:hypothetical protein